MFTRTKRFAAAASLIAASATAVAVQSVDIDPRLPMYRAAPGGVSGSIKSVGSDTMNNLMTLWAEDFQRMYPNVQVEIEGKGSSTAPPALISGASTFGPMSRAMKSAEIDEFEKAYDYKPTAVRAAIDMLAVFVHKDNPIARTGLTLEQVDGIFSRTRKGGGQEIITWGDLGLTGEWADKPISLYGRNAASGTYGYFKSVALFKGDFKDSVKEQPGSSAVIQGVARDKYGIGYSGIGYATADVVAIPLSKKGEATKVPPTAETVASYPLARFLYVYVNHKPNYELDPLRREFLLYIFSKQGQQSVIKDGYIPVSAAVAARDLQSVDLELRSN